MKASKVMGIIVGFLVVSLALVGCCSNPDAVKQIQAGYDQAQSLAYGADGNLLPDVSKALSDPKVKEGVAAADLALSLAGMAKTQYCATVQQAAQVQAAAATAATNLAPIAAPANPTSSAPAASPATP